MIDKSLNSVVYIKVLLVRKCMAKNKSPTSAEIEPMASGFDHRLLYRLSYEGKRYSTIGINGIAYRLR